MLSRHLHMGIYPTPVLLPRKSHGRRSLVGCSPWGRYSRTGLSDFTFTFHFHALEKEMATHSSVLAWRIPGTGSLVGCRLWGRTESDTTEATQQQLVLAPHTPDLLVDSGLASPTSAHRDPATSSSCSVKSTCNSKNEINENPGGTWSRKEDF